jgi:DNA-binding MarR family transcriptional regulator
VPTQGRFPATADVPNRELLDEAMRFAGAMRRLADEDPGMPYARMRVLEILACDGPSRMRDLAGEVGLLPRNLTSVADALEADGLVRRTPHPEDRRATLLEITPEGTAETRRRLAPRLAALATVFDVLAPPDRARLTTDLRRLSAAAEVRRGRVGRGNRSRAGDPGDPVSPALSGS